MNGAPNKWAEVAFGEINTFTGRTLDPSLSPAEPFELYSVPTFPTRRPEFLLGANIGSTKQTVEPGDVLVCKINPRINRVWQVGKRGTHRQIASSEWIVMRSRTQDATFLRHYFSSPRFRELISEGVTGVGGSLTRAQPSRVALFPVPIAPLAEQKRIAKKLDALLARVDQCSDRLEGFLEILKRFRQALLRAATSGNLTREWRKKRGLRKNWRETRVEEIASVGTGSTPLRSNSSFYSKNGVPWITSAATGRPFVTHAEEFVTKAAIAAHRLRQYPVGTLLVAMYGEGKTRGQVTELRIAATINQACAAISVDEGKATKAFVRLVLESNYLQMRELAEGGNQPNLNLSKIKEFPLSLPSLDEQHAIAERVERIAAWLRTIEQRTSAAREIVERLRPAMLTKAFRGELVPQDPNDEPAADLVARLRQPPVDTAESKSTVTRQRTKAGRGPRTRRSSRAR